MTVGIGALCQGGKCILMAADMRGSFSDPTFPPHEYLGKQYDLPYGFVANTAGSKHVCQSVSSELYNQLLQFKDKPSILHDHVRNAIRDTQYEEFLYRVEQEMKFRLGTTINEWKAMSTTSLHYRRCQRLVSRYFLNMQLTVGGFLSDGSPVLLTATGNEPPEMEEIAVIGSGTDPALSVLAERGQNPHTSVVRTVFHIHEAMEVAQANDPYVGRCEAFVVLTPKQIRILQLDSAFVVELVSAFSGRDTAPLDDDLSRFNQFMAELHDPGITLEEYKGGKRRIGAESNESDN